MSGLIRNCAKSILKRHHRGKLPETGVIRKRWNNRVTVALVFPDTYALGMSNLGFQRAYELLNGYDQIAAERFLLPESFKCATGLRSIESNRSLKEFDLILFSISFEYSYLNVPLVLSGGGLPLFSTERGAECPLIIAGGIACQINPEPVAPLVDGFLLGDFEAICPRFIEFLDEGDSLGRDGREEVLERLALSCSGVYVPRFHEAISADISLGDHRKCGDRIVPALEEGPPDILPHSVVLSENAAFPCTFLVEVSRGCGRGCRFCAAGYVYRPPRPWPVSSIKDTLSMAENARKIGLVGLEFLEKEGLHELLSSLLENRREIGFSSLRADAVTEDFARLLVASGSKTATVAAEAGSERLRKIINKNLTEDQIFACCDRLISAGIKNLKLYFMLGLPFEEDGDVEELIRISREIRSMLIAAGKGRGSLGHLTVSISTFVPKAWTPFQWAAFVDRDVLERRRTILEKGLRHLSNVRLRLDSPERALVQAILSRGDRDLANDLVLSRLKGRSGRRMVKKLSFISEKYLRGRPRGGHFPWEILKHRVKRDFLYSQWEKARRCTETSFCDLEKCRRCGACR